MKFKGNVVMVLSFLLFYAPLVPAATSSPAGQMVTNGNAAINGVAAPKLTSVFSGDRIATEKQSVTSLTFPGGDGVVIPELSKAVLGERDGHILVNLEDGTLSVMNHNHFAGLLEMFLPLALGLALYHWQKARERMRRNSLRDFFRHLGDPEMQKCYLLLLAAAVLSLALVFSFSRMGLISMLASLGVMAAVIWAGRGRGPLPAALILFLIAAGVATAMWVGVEPVVKHFEELSHDDPLAQRGEGRLALWKDTLKLIRERPWTGSGLGSFAVAFTSIQSHELAYSVDHAHNDYLEFSAELGIPAAAFLFLGFLAIAARTLRASRLAPSSRTRALALGTLAGIIALLVHGFADFNLHIPANALVFSVLLGMGYAMSMELSAPVRHIDHAAQSSKPLAPERNEEVAEVRGSRSS